MDAIARADTPAARDRVYRSFLATDWLMPTAAPQDADKKTLRLVATTDRNGDRSMLAFTDEDALRRWRASGGAYAVVRGSSLFAIARDNSFASITVNPAGPAGGLVFRREIEILALGSVPDLASASPTTAFTLPSKTTLSVGPAAHLPDALVRAIRDGLRRVPEVRTARVAMTAAGNDAPRPTIALEVGTTVSADERSRIAAELGTLLTRHLEEGRSLDMLFMTPGEDLAESFAKVEPLYRRD
jgi:hypothetical protein